MAGAASQITVYPLDMTKTRLALSTTGCYDGIYDCIRTTIHQEGIRGLYRGLVPALIGIIPAAGIDLAVHVFSVYPLALRVDRTVSRLLDQSLTQMYASFLLQVQHAARQIYQVCAGA